MLQCPACDTTLTQDFGMVTCPNCQAVLMIDISGKVQMAGDEPESEESWDEQSQTASWNNSDDNDGEVSKSETDDAFFETNSFDSSSNLESDAEDFDEDSDDDFAANTTSFAENQDDSDYTDNNDEGLFASDESDLEASENGEQEASAWDDEPDGEDSSQTDDDAGFEDPVDDEDAWQATAPRLDGEPEHLEEFPMPAEPDPNPVDVTDFANSEESNLEGGEILYDLKLSRIDSKEQKEAVKYTLMDGKLKLDHKELMKNIKGGELTVPDLNPIKAKRIVEQLQYTDLDIQWRQKRVIMEVVEPADPGVEDDPEMDANF